MSLIIDATYGCYHAMGFPPKGNCLNKLVLGFGKEVKLFPAVEYTEIYLYEEFIFSTNLAREAESLYQFITKIIKFSIRESQSDEVVSAQELHSKIITLGYEVVDILLEQACICQIHNKTWFIDFAIARLKAYEPLFEESYYCKDPIPERNNFHLGFGTRDHPLFKYLGTVSDHFADALNIDRDYPLLQSMVLNRYTRFHEIAKSISGSLDI